MIYLKIQISHPIRSVLRSQSTLLFSCLCGPAVSATLTKVQLPNASPQTVKKRFSESLTLRDEMKMWFAYIAQFLASRQQFPLPKLSNWPNKDHAAFLTSSYNFLQYTSSGLSTFQRTKLDLTKPSNFSCLLKLTWSSAAFLERSKIFFWSPSVSMLFLMFWTK